MGGNANAFAIQSNPGNYREQLNARPIRANLCAGGKSVSSFSS